VRGVWFLVGFVLGLVAALLVVIFLLGAQAIGGVA
jgi:hypothetical protein